MKTSRIRIGLWLLALIFSVTAVGVLIWAAATPTSVATDDGPSIKAAVAHAALRDPSIQAFSAVWSLNLTRPLVSVGAVPKLAPHPTPLGAPPPPFQLLGTVVEAGHSMAILVRADGKLQWESVGDYCAGIEVLNVGSSQVTVRYNEQSVVLRVERGNHYWRD